MTLFRQLVQENAWTTVQTFGTQFTKAARELAAETGERRLADITIARRTFDRWMAGDLKSMPQKDTRRILEHLFHHPVTRLFDAIGGADQGASTAAPAARSGILYSHISSVRTLYGVFDDPLEVASETLSLTQSNADTSLIEHFHRQLHGVVDRYEALGPQTLAGEARLLRSTMHTLLKGQHPPSVRAELFRLTGRAAGLLAYMAVNAGAAPAVAEAYCVEAEALAQHVGDTQLQMWATGTRSLSLYYQRRYAEADAAAAAGLDLAPNNGQAIRLLANGRSRALARLGDRKGAERAIGMALDLSDRQPDLSSGITSCISFSTYSHARTLANVITSRLSLNDADKVLSCAEEIDGLVEQSDSEWSRALVRLDVATALLQQAQPEVEQAMALGQSALHAGTTAPIRSVWQRANELYERAERWHAESDVGDYAEELRTWRSRPLAEPIVTGSGVELVPQQ
jgi:tetratricopeptide (TPR) repeat protein